MLLETHVSSSPSTNISLLFQTVSRAVDTEYYVCRQLQLAGVSDWWQHGLLLFMGTVGAISIFQPPVADRWIQLYNHQCKHVIFCLHKPSCITEPTAFCLLLKMTASSLPSVRLWGWIYIKSIVYTYLLTCMNMIGMWEKIKQTSKTEPSYSFNFVPCQHWKYFSLIFLLFRMYQ